MSMGADQGRRAARNPDNLRRVSAPKFKKVLPHDYDRMLRLHCPDGGEGRQAQRAGPDRAFYAMKKKEAGVPWETDRLYGNYAAEIAIELPPGAHPEF